MHTLSARLTSKHGASNFKCHFSSLCVLSGRPGGIVLLLSPSILFGPLFVSQVKHSLCLPTLGERSSVKRTNQTKPTIENSPLLPPTPSSSCHKKMRYNLKVKQQEMDLMTLTHCNTEIHCLRVSVSRIEAIILLFSLTIVKQMTTIKKKAYGNYFVLFTICLPFGVAK